jgi:hypothetical protein
MEIEGNAGNAGNVENELMRILAAFPNANWSYEVLSNNPNLSKEYILANISKLNMKNLTYRFIEEPQFIYEHPELNWDTSVMYMVNLNTPFAIQVLRRYKDVIDFDGISECNSTVNLDIMYANPDLPWNKELYAQSMYVLPEVVANYPKFNWNYDQLSKDLQITAEEYKEYMKLGFTKDQIIADQVVKKDKFNKIGANLVPLQYIQENIHRCTTTIYIAPDSFITWDFIQASYPYARWDFTSLIRLLLKNKEYNNIIHVMTNCNDRYYTVAPMNNKSSVVKHLSHMLPVEFILQHNFPWDWRYVMKKSGLTWEAIVERKLCDNPELSVNPNITLEIILSNPQINWDFGIMSENTFKLSRV